MSYRIGNVSDKGDLRMAEHKHGSMDIEEHEKTFEGFVRFSSTAAGLAILVLIFLALANS